MTSQGQRFRRRALRRGYKVDEVDAFLDRVEATLNGDPISAPVAAQEVHDVVFRVRFNGYDEWQVDLHLDRVERQLSELEERGGFARPDGRALPVGDRGPHDRMPMDRMGPPDRLGPPDRIGPPDRMYAERGGPPMREDRMGPPMRDDRMMPPGRDDRSLMPPPGPGGRPPAPIGPPPGYGRYDEPPMPGRYDEPTLANRYDEPPVPSRYDEPTGGGRYDEPTGGGRYEPFEPGRHGKMDMTTELRMPPDFGGGIGPSGELARIDQLRRTFQPRRFGSGYDPGQVDRLFEGILAAMSSRSPVSINDAELDPAQFNLVPGGYFEAEVDQALREVRDIIRRR